MSDVIAVRVPKKLKEELQKLNMDYADDVRECLERKVKTEKLKRVMKEIDTFRTELSKKTGTTEPSVDIIREDRDHGH
jgi:predicted transcriptional regulator